MSYLIIGGTGTLGKATIKALLKREPRANITVLSREELKQQKLIPKYPNVKFVIGDIKDYSSIDPHVKGKNVVFHFAALKHVDICENNPEECIKSNLIGTMNVRRAIESHSIKYGVFCSTDKAVLPINIYGYCKGASEKLWQSPSPSQFTHYSVFRWGNILTSRGAVIHHFAECLLTKKEVNLTHPDMSRFWSNIDEVVNFMIDNYSDKNKKETMIPPMKAATVVMLIDAVARVLEVKDYKVNITGIRDGEKIHECLKSTHSDCLRSDNAEQYSFDELVELIKTGLANAEE